MARSPSDWVHKVFLTCDNMIAVQFNRGMKEMRVAEQGPGALLGHGGVPGPCCLYPGTQGELAESLYDLALVWPYAGEWVHRFLYRKFGYQVIAPPLACGGCETKCELTSSVNPGGEGNGIVFTARVTNLDGSPTKGDAPSGRVEFWVDGELVCNVPLPEQEPDTGNYQEAECTWPCALGTHTVQALYFPDEADFAQSSASLSQVCQSSGGISTPCCPATTVPATLYVTWISTTPGCECLDGASTRIDYDAVAGAWQGSGVLCGSAATTFTLQCDTMLNEFTLTTGGGCGDGLRETNLTVFHCSPFHFETVDVGVPCCTGTGHWVITP